MACSPGVTGVVSDTGGVRVAGKGVLKMIRPGQEPVMESTGMYQVVKMLARMEQQRAQTERGSIQVGRKGLPQPQRALLQGPPG